MSKQLNLAFLTLIVLCNLSILISQNPSVNKIQPRASEFEEYDYLNFKSMQSFGEILRTVNISGNLIALPNGTNQIHYNFQYAQTPLYETSNLFATSNYAFSAQFFFSNSIEVYYLNYNISQDDFGDYCLNYSSNHSITINLPESPLEFSLGYTAERIDGLLLTYHKSMQKFSYISENLIINDKTFQYTNTMDIYGISSYYTKNYSQTELLLNFHFRDSEFSYFGNHSFETFNNSANLSYSAKLSNTTQIHNLNNISINYKVQFENEDTKGILTRMKFELNSSDFENYEDFKQDSFFYEIIAYEVINETWIPVQYTRSYPILELKFEFSAYSFTFEYGIQEYNAIGYPSDFIDKDYGELALWIGGITGLTLILGYPIYRIKHSLEKNLSESKNVQDKIP